MPSTDLGWVYDVSLHKPKTWTSTQIRSRLQEAFPNLTMIIKDLNLFYFSIFLCETIIQIGKWLHKCWYGQRIWLGQSTVGLFINSWHPKSAIDPTTFILLGQKSKPAQSVPFISRPWPVKGWPTMERSRSGSQMHTFRLTITSWELDYMLGPMSRNWFQKMICWLEMAHFDLQGSQPLIYIWAVLSIYSS